MSDVKKEKKPRTEKQLAHTQKLILMNKERAVIRNKQKAEGTYVAPVRKSKKKIKAETLIIKEVQENEEPSLTSSPVRNKEPKPLYKQVIKKKPKKRPKTPPPPESDASTDLEDDIPDYASDESGVHALSGHYGNEEEYYDDLDEIPLEPNYTPDPEEEPEPVIKVVKRRRTYHR